MKSLIYLLAILWSTSVLAANPHDTTKPQQDKERIQGTWSIVVTFDESGNKLPGEAAANIHVVITDKTILFKNHSQDGLQVEYTLDSSKNPKSIDTTHEIDPGKPIPQLGIYSLNDDTLTLCISAAGVGRPKSLTDDTTSKFVLKRLESQLLGVWVLVGSPEAVGDIPKAGPRHNVDHPHHQPRRSHGPNPQRLRTHLERGDAMDRLVPIPPFSTARLGRSVRRPVEGIMWIQPPLMRLPARGGRITERDQRPIVVALDWRERRCGRSCGEDG